MTNTLLFILLSGGLSIFVMGAGIGIIVLIFYSVMNAGVSKVIDTIDPPKDFSKMSNTEEILTLARACIYQGNLEKAKKCCKRIIELNSKSTEAWIMLANLVFAEDSELSFKGFKIMEQQIKREGKKFTDKEFENYGLFFYMLGYHYHNHANKVKGKEFKDIAMKNKKFIKDYPDFINKYSY